jgi:hypothetical protein
MRPRSLRIADVAGANAWRDGLFPEDNPYPDGSATRLAWEQAYYAAERREKEHRAFMAKLRREKKAREVKE